MKSYIFSFPGRRLLCAVLLGTITLLGSCKKDPETPQPGPGTENPTGNDPLKPTPSVTTTVAGRVTDEDGKPLSNVRVTVHGKQTVTSVDGLFTLENISVPGNRCVITCKKDEYFEGIRAQVPTAGQVTRTQIVLMRSAATHTFQAASGSTATLDNGSAVQIPAASLVTESGGAYTGQVNMVVRYQDPTAADFSTTVAGGDMLAQRTDRSTSILYSYGILRVKMTGSNGEALQMAPGKTASLTIAIPSTQQATAPATIPLWYFDEATGVWIEEGAAAKQGNQYVGTVKHFTDWNADDPKDRATIIGRLVDCDGHGTMFAPIELGQKTTWSEKRDGAFSETVPTGVPIHVTVKPFMAAHPGKQIIIVPPLSPGQVFDVGVIRPEADFCTAEVKGRVKTKSGDHVSSITFSNANGALDLYQPGTDFSVMLPTNTTIHLKIHTAQGAVFTKTFETAANKTATDLGEINLDQSPVAVTGLVACGSAPVGGATVTFNYNDQVTTATTDASGAFRATLPGNQSVLLRVTHDKGTATTTFQTVSGSSQALPAIDLCAPAATAGENSFVIDGDGFVKAHQTLGYDKAVSYAAYGMVLEDDDNTVVSVIDPSDAWKMTVMFAGKATGTVGPDQAVTMALHRKAGDGYQSYLAGSDVDESTLSLKVTRYDAVGGLVEGTYSGNFMGISPTGKKIWVTITEGKFSAVRLPDLTGE